MSQYHTLLQKTASTPHRKKILILWLKHVQLLQMMDLTEEARERYYSPRESKIDPRKSRLLPHLLKAITTDAYIYKEIATAAENYASDLESLIGVLDAVPELNASASTNTFLPLARELRGLCSELRRSTADMPKTLEHHLKFLEMRRNIEESSSLWVLTVLASIFLPLSLACGILSMQTRLKDLHSLLFDFCGVVVILLTLVVAILAMLKLTIWIHGKWLQHTSEREGRLVNIFAKVTLGSAIVSTWAVFFAAFVIGMFRDLRLGGLVLGYGLAGLIGAGLLSSASTWLLWWLVRYS